MSDLTRGLEEIDAAQARYVIARDYYDGRIDEVMSVASGLTLKLARAAARYRINFAKTPVNVVADRMEIAAVSVPGDETATNVLESAVWKRNQLLLETPDANRMACMYGDYYIVVWPGMVEGEVDVFFNSPVGMRLIYDTENPRVKSYAVKKWRDGDRLRATVYYADRIERYVTVAPNVSGDSENDWVEYTEDGQPWPTPNPYGEVPVFHLRTASPYGESVHKDAYGTQDGLNKILITMMTTIDYAGFPLRYALVEGDAQLTGATNPGPPWGADADATTETRADIKLDTGPGAVWLASGLKDVGQLDPADPKNFLEPADFLIRAMAQTTTTPLHYFDPSGDVPSGESLRAADAPLVKKVEYLQMRFASAYAEAFSFALKILGFANAAVDVRWAPATSTDDKDSWETAALKIANGVPVRQVLLEQGYTAEQVDEWIATTGEESLAQRVTLLADLGRAVQSLGAGISLGAVSAPSVQAAVQGILQPVIDGGEGVL